jgi:hypothetical protein
MGGERAYRAGLGKDRSTGESRHSHCEPENRLYRPELPFARRNRLGWCGILPFSRDRRNEEPLPLQG